MMCTCKATCEAVWRRRKYFECFGGLHSVVTAARDGKGPDEVVSMERDGQLMIADPDYEAPQVLS